MQKIERDMVLRLYSLIIFRLGVSKYGKDVPKLILISGKEAKNFGEYSNDNTITIWWQMCSNMSEFAETLLHEYSHYLQYWPWYIRYSRSHTYEENPYEIQAINLSEKYPEYIKDTTDQNWLKLYSENKRLNILYNSLDFDSLKGEFPDI